MDALSQQRRNNRAEQSGGWQDLFVARNWGQGDPDQACHELVWLLRDLRGLRGRDQGGQHDRGQSWSFQLGHGRRYSTLIISTRLVGIWGCFTFIDCGVDFETTFVEKCNVSTAKRMFNHFFGENPGNTQTLPTDPERYRSRLEGIKTCEINVTGQIRNRMLTEFDQTEFTRKYESYTGFDDLGYLYIPEACYLNSANCKLMVYLHGCISAREYVGKDFVLGELLHFRLRTASNFFVCIFQPLESCQEWIFTMWLACSPK